MKADVLEKLLLQSNYCSKKTKYLLKGFRTGFSLGYKGPTENIQRVANNLKFRVGSEAVLWYKVMKEVKEKRFAGPYKQVPIQELYTIPNRIGAKGS